VVENSTISLVLIFALAAIDFLLWNTISSFVGVGIEFLVF